MAILFELSESIVKQASLVASKYPDRSLLSVIEECFNYGVKSLYSDAPKPIPPKKVIENKELFNEPLEEDKIENIRDITDYVIGQAKQEIDDMVCYSDEEIPDSLSEPVLNSDGLFEL